VSELLELRRAAVLGEITRDDEMVESLLPCSTERPFGSPHARLGIDGAKKRKIPEPNALTERAPAYVWFEKMKIRKMGDAHKSYRGLRMPILLLSMGYRGRDFI